MAGRKKTYPWDEVQAREAEVAFLEQRLEDALERLGAAIAYRDDRLKRKTPRRGDGEAL